MRQMSSFIFGNSLCATRCVCGCLCVCGVAIFCTLLFVYLICQLDADGRRCRLLWWLFNIWLQLSPFKIGPFTWRVHTLCDIRRKLKFCRFFFLSLSTWMFLFIKSGKYTFSNRSSNAMRINKPWLFFAFVFFLVIRSYIHSTFYSGVIVMALAISNEKISYISLSKLWNGGIFLLLSCRL